MDDSGSHRALQINSISYGLETEQHYLKSSMPIHVQEVEEDPSSLCTDQTRLLQNSSSSYGSCEDEEKVVKTSLIKKEERCCSNRDIDLVIM